MHTYVYNRKKRLQNNVHPFCTKFILILSISFFFLIFDANPTKWLHEPHISCILQFLRPATSRREAREFYNWEVTKSGKFRMIMWAAEWEVDWSRDPWNQGSLLEATVYKKTWCECELWQWLQRQKVGPSSGAFKSRNQLPLVTHYSGNEGKFSRSRDWWDDDNTNWDREHIKESRRGWQKAVSLNSVSARGL